MYESISSIISGCFSLIFSFNPLNKLILATKKTIISLIKTPTNDSITAFSGSKINPPNIINVTPGIRLINLIHHNITNINSEYFIESINCLKESTLKSIFKLLAKVLTPIILNAIAIIIKIAI